MARINIDDELHAEKGFKRLVRNLGDEDRATGMLYRFWRIAQDYWGDEMSLMPFQEFAADGFDPILECGLAEIRETGVYAKGAEDRFAWYLQKCRASKAAVRARMANRNDAAGQSSSRAADAPEPSPRSTGDTEPDNPTVPVPVPATVTDKKTKTGNAVAVAPAPTGKPPGKRSKYSDETRAKMRAFFDAYAKAYRERYGGPPEGLRDPRVVGQIGTWIEQVSSDRACLLAQIYLQIDHRRITESDHDLWCFLRSLNKIGNALNSGVHPSGIDWAKVFGEKAS